MSEWKLHLPTDANTFTTYKCGLVAGQQVALRKDLAIVDHLDKPIGETRAKGEVWTVLPGLFSDPVLWLRDSNGDRHTWDDDPNEVSEWFEVIDCN